MDTFFGVVRDCIDDSNLQETNFRHKKFDKMEQKKDDLI